MSDLALIYRGEYNESTKKIISYDEFTNQINALFIRWRAF